MSHRIHFGLVALLASALYAAGAAAAQNAGTSIEAAGVGADPDAIVLAAAQTAVAAAPPPPTPPAEPSSEPGPQSEPASPGAAEPEAEGGAGAEPGAGPEPQVDTRKKVWLGLMVLVIIAAVVWLFSRNRPKTNVTK